MVGCHSIWPSELVAFIDKLFIGAKVILVSASVEIKVCIVDGPLCRMFQL